MDNPTRRTNEDLRTLAEQQPVDASRKNAEYEAYVRQEIEAGLADARRGDFASEDEVKDVFAKWGVQK